MRRPRLRGAALGAMLGGAAILAGARGGGIETVPAARAAAPPGGVFVDGEVPPEHAPSAAAPGSALEAGPLAGGLPLPGGPRRTALHATVQAFEASLDGEPPVEVLQEAALRTAKLDPAVLERMVGRARAAALLPQLRVRLGRGGGEIRATSDYDGATRLTLGDRDGWQLDVAASWSLERVAYSPEEARLLREAQAVSGRRERLLSVVAALWAERRRLQARIALGPVRDPLALAELRTRLAEATAVLDGLTGGALRGCAQAGLARCGARRDARHPGGEVEGGE